MKQRQVAIIGYGYWGINVAKGIEKSEHFALYTIFDEDSQRMQEAQKLYTFKSYKSYDEILCEDEIQDIFIITPPHTHYALAKQALNAKKNVFVEKPLTTCTQEAEELYDLAYKHSLSLYCDHIFLHSPAVQYLKEQIATFGDIVYLNARRINLGLFQNNVDVIWDLAIHDLSIMDYLVGLNIKKVSTFSKKYQNYPNDALANINLELDNGIISTINVSWLSPTKVREIMIGGTHKSAIYDETQSHKIRIFDTGVIIQDELDKNSLYTKMVQYHLGKEEIPKLSNAMSLDRSIAYFYHLIMGQTPCLREHTLRVIKALEWISKSL